MLKILYIIRDIFRRRRSRLPEDTPDWASDPLSHPEIMKMSAGQLADLPFPRPCAPDMARPDCRQSHYRIAAE